MSIQTIYNVKGMHCASCVALIEDKLAKIQGVASVSAKLNQERVAIDFKDAPIETKVLSNAISPFGYTLEDMNKKDTSTGMHDHMKMMQENAEKDMGLEMKFVLPMVGFSFVMMLWQVLSQNNLIPQMSETVYEFFHHLMPIFEIGRAHV